MNHTLRDGLRIMEYLAYAEGPRSLTDIANSLALGKSKTHRLLQTLMLADYAFQAPNSNKYVASMRFWELGSAMLRHASLKTTAEKQMQELMEATGESVHLSILEKAEIVYVHKIDSDDPVRAYSQIGGRMPAHLVATGKAMLAFKSEQAQIGLYAMSAAQGLASRKSQNEFLAEMAEIRRTRVSVNYGEWRKDVHGVASPIIDRRGNVVAAVGVSGPARRFQAERIPFLADEVKRAAMLITEQLFGAAGNARWP